MSGTIALLLTLFFVVISGILGYPADPFNSTILYFVLLNHFSRKDSQ